MFELIGQMMRLPFATFAYVLEAMAETVTNAGRLTDRGVERVLRPGPPGGIWHEPPQWGGDDLETASGARAPGEDGSEQRGAAGRGAEANEREGRKMADTNLSDDSVKLVHYVIVSIERDRERKLANGDGYEIVTDNMTGESFAAWMIAQYLQQPEEQKPEKLGEDEKKYLRVCYDVVCRWPRESLHYESKQLTRLDDIERAIRGEPRTEGAERRLA